MRIGLSLDLTQPRGGAADPGPSHYEFDLTEGALPDGASLARATACQYWNSSGDYVSAAANVARFDYPYNGTAHVLAGLLVEPARENILENSNALPFWSTKTEITIGTASGNGLNASPRTTITPSAVSGEHLISAYNPFSPSSDEVTVSIFVRKEGNDYRLRFDVRSMISGSDANGAYIEFDPQTEDITSGVFGDGEIISTGVEKVKSNDWFRMWMRLKGPASTGSFRCFLRLVDPTGALTFAGTGDADSRVAVGFAQLEVPARDTPTEVLPRDSFFPTSTAPDVLTFAVTNGAYDMEVETPNGVFTTSSPITVSGGGGYVFDWADFTGAAAERHLRKLTAVRV